MNDNESCVSWREFLSATRMKIFSKFEISRGKGEATPKKGKLQERTSNLRMQ